MKKVLAIILSALMLLSVVACTNNDSKDGDNDQEEKKDLTMWLWTTDLEQYAQRYEEATGNHIEISYVQDTNDLLTKYQTSLGAKSSELDIIVGEANMLDQYFEAGWVASLEDYASDSDFDMLIDYVVDAGTDDDGVVRCIGYQATPGGIYYRADIAREIFGTDDPDEIHEQVFKDYDSILDAADKLYAKGYCMFNDTGDLGMFASQNESWIDDNGKAHISDARLAYLDAAYDLYTSGALSFNSQWTSTWYAAMGGPIPQSISTLLANAQDGAQWNESFLESEEYLEAMEGDTVEVFAYGLPTWGIVFFNSYAGTLTGEWRFCEGPCAYVNGGSWLGISEYSENKEAAWDFIKFVCLNEESAEWWATSQSDFVSLKSVDEAHADDEIAMLGGEKVYQKWLEIADQVDYSIYGLYDRDLDQYFGSAVGAYQQGTVDRDGAIAMFWESVQNAYPDLVPDDVK